MPLDVPLAPRPSAVTDTQVFRLIHHADAELAAARARLRAAEEAHALAPSGRARTERSGASYAFEQALQACALVRGIWDSSGRVAELATARLERATWREDGFLILNVLGKGKGEGPAPRDVALTPHTASLVRELVQHRNDGRLPLQGYIFPGRLPGRPLTAQAVSRIVQKLAARADVQFLDRPDQRTHKYHLKAKDIRLRSEAHVVHVRGIPAKAAANVAGHTTEIQDRHYLGADEETAVHVARARTLPPPR